VNPGALGQVAHGPIEQSSRRSHLCACHRRHLS
jgi:hypothetical protein